MTFDDSMALLEDCAEREKENMFNDEIAVATANFVESVVCICEKYGKDANEQVALVLSAAMVTARGFNFNKRKGGKDK